jgi:hypothetical protein
MFTNDMGDIKKRMWRAKQLQTELVSKAFIIVTKGAL